LKKAKRIISWTIWSLLALYLALVLLIQLPYIQRWLGSVVAGAISQKLGTDVHVGRVNLGFFNRIIIDDVSIADQQQTDMVKARRLSVKLELLPLLNGRVAVSSAQLFGAECSFYRDSASAEPNYQFVLNALSNKDKEASSSFDLHIGSLIVSRLSLSYHQKDAPPTPGRFNPRHLTLTDVSAHILLRTLTPDALDLQVKRLSLHEQSGLALQQLAFKVEADSTSAVLSDFLLKTPQSALSIDSIKAFYLTDNLEGTLRYATSPIHLTFEPADFVSLLPSPWPTDHSFAAEAQVSGTFHSVDHLQLDMATIDTDALSINLSGGWNSREWQCAINRFYASAQLLSALHEALPALPPLVTELGNVSLSGRAASSADGGVAIHGDARTSAQGSLSLQGTISTQGDSWQAHIATDSLDLHLLSATPFIGVVATELDLRGQGDEVQADGIISRIDLKGYSYHNLQFNASYAPDQVGGKLKVNDPNLQADVEGQVSFTPASPHVRLTGYINKIAPKVLLLSDRWGEATFAAVVDADVAASSLATAKGAIDFDDFVMTLNDSTIFHLDNLHVKSDYADNRHVLRVKSDFGEVLLNGHFNLSTLPHSLAAVVPSLLPADRSNDNNFNLSMQLTDSRWIQQLLGIDFDLDGPLHLLAQVCDSNKTVDITADIPSFSYGTGTYRDASMNLLSQGDSSQLNIEITRLSANGSSTRILADARTAGDQLLSALTLNTDHAGGGTVNTITRLYKNEAGAREAHIRVMPSALIMKGQMWELEPCDILYSENQLMVDHFALHRADEHLIVDGIASTLATDTLLIDLQGIDVASILDLVNFHSVKFGGKATGKAYVCHAFSSPEAWADISVDQLLFQEAPMGRLEAHAVWNVDEGQIDLDAAIDDGAEEQTYIDGFVSPRQKALDLGIRARGTSIAFIHSFTKSFMNSMEGQAYGDIRVYGPLKHIDLSGEAIVNGMAAIKPLGTTYTFSGDTVRLTEGSIALRNFHAYDRDNHVALLNGAITHSNLKNIHVDLHATANDLLAYDFPTTDGTSSIGGTVWVDGDASISVRPGETVINCDITPTPSSVFVYNAANTNTVSSQQFITWGTAPDAPPTTSEGTSINSPLAAKAIVAPSGAEGGASGASDLYLNLRINATPDATLRLLMDQHSGDFITLNGLGVLRASYYNKGPFQMFGTYNVERGTYSMTIQNILKKNFLFQTGSTLVFGGDPLQAALNLKAQHTVNGVSLSDLGLGNSFTSNTIRVNCLMNIVGTAGEPRVEFDLEMPTVNSEEEQMIRSIIASEQELNQQVVYLLGIGRFYTQGANNAASQSYGQTELAMQSLLSGTVSSQINQLLSQVIKTDDWNFGANISTGNEGWHNAEYEGLISGRMLGNRLLVNGQFGYRDNATQTAPSFIGDFDIQYLLTPGGSLALKAYNQTNDRYFTHSSLNTQGIGIIMKKDFNGLADLFSHRRKKTGK